MNPFLTVWTKPNQTLRYLIEEKTIGYGLLVLMLTTLGTSLMVFADTGTLEGFSLPVILLLSIALALVVGIPMYFFNAGVYLLIGKMLGGKSRYQDVCLAISGSSIPMLGMFPISVLAIVLYGTALYTEPVGNFAVTNMSAGFFIFNTLFMLGFSIYGIVLLSKGLGFAHQFSTLRGFGAILIVVAIVFFIGIIIAFLVIFGTIMILSESIS